MQEPVSNDVPEAMAVVWDQVLGQLTAQGATREDIARMTLDVAHTITARTFDALFPGEDPINPAERQYAVPLAEAAGVLATAMTDAASEPDPVPDVTDATDSGDPS